MSVRGGFSLFLISFVFSIKSVVAFASLFHLESNDVSNNKKLSIKQVYNGFGCHGGNLSPQLSWSHEPEGTKSFAVTVYDPDAPSISGWWHWVLVDIPVSVHHLDTGSSSMGKLPDGSFEVRNDFGTRHFGGPCPPVGEKAHRYFVTVWALKVPKLPLSVDSTAAMAGFMLVSNALGKSEVVPYYQR
ncbi:MULTISPECIES: YbhB/YbcL family Raf kinase inhibitor-like protein [Candidatus Ichthyocystis]|uniref:YbhB/YbcL family Raf kinase inhibitor-like protein n=1 Tax=Candidatus Ichthyocystis TaxID=2929841 RepID=UPI000AA3DF88|nr:MULTISPECIES: YbhB/YbcL family Raf kinase inhibitor-like protein [Ichthyocystis]